MIKSYLFAVALVTAASAIAQSAPASDAATPPAAPAKEKKVCRSQAVTGSIMSKSVCHTKTDWAAIDEANRVDADSALSRRNGPATQR